MSAVAQTPDRGVGASQAQGDEEPSAPNVLRDAKCSISILDAALKLARQGLPVFPCNPLKKPFTAHGFKEATTDEATIKGWWAKWPNAMIGMPTGPTTGIAVLDLDVKNGKNGLAAIPDWETLSPVIAETQSGGKHVYLRDDESITSTSDKLAKGVDTRGAGGYVIVPPSPGYRFTKSTDLSELPAWPDKYRLSKRQSPPPPPSGSKKGADPKLIAQALASIPNPNSGWDDWNRIGMAIWAATGGSEEGFKLFDDFSQKSDKYDSSITRDRWDGITKSPPSEIGAGSLFFEAGTSDPNWRGDDFKCDGDGKIVASSQHNIRVALHKLGLTLSYDEFNDQKLITGLADIGPLVDDPTMEQLWLLIDERFGFRPGWDFFLKVISVVARKNGFHPVRDYLDDLLTRWDGVPRVDTWLTAYGGAEDTPYTRAVGALMLVAAVRRIRQPGCKFDEMLVLESNQGKDKSAALKVLAVKEGWFSDDMPLNARGKETIECLRGRWIIECAELQGMRKGDIEHVKAMLSRQTDRARLSYDRMTTEVARQSVFFGTTNSSKYLRDLTGARRFWPVAVGTFDNSALKRDRDQLWAEAVVREARGDSIRLDPSLYNAAAVEQQARTVDDPWRDQLEHVLDGITGKILNADAWEIIGVPMGMRDQTHNARFGEAMKALGWERTEGRIDGKKRNVYARGTKQEREVRVFIKRDEQTGRISAQAGKPEPEEDKKRATQPALDLGDGDEPPF